MTGNITLPDKHGICYTVARELPSSPFQSLGAFLALDGNQDEHKEVVTSKSDIFGSQVRF